MSALRGNENSVGQKVAKWQERKIKSSARIQEISLCRRSSSDSTKYGVAETVVNSPRKKSITRFQTARSS